MTAPWPIEGDSDLNIARAIARAYRDALAGAAPEQCRTMDAQAARFGQGWVTPQLAVLDLSDFASAAEVAELVGTTVDNVYQWASRGRINRYRDTNNRPVYLVREVVDYHAEQRRTRIERHARGRSGQIKV